MMPRVVLRALRMLLRGLFFILAPLDHTGSEHIPATGAVILCANHQSLADPIGLICTLTRWVRFMGKKELFGFKPFGALLRGLGAFPVARGDSDLGAIRTALALLNKGEVLGIFPQGRREHKGGAAFHTGVALIALRSRAPVIPVYIAARPRLFRKTRLIYGPPVDLSAYSGRADSQTLRQATARIQQAVYALKDLDLL